LAAVLCIVGSSISFADENAKDLTRDIEEVVVTGAMVSGWQGQEIDRIHLYKWGGTEFVKIPFQIDRVGLVDIDQKCSWFAWGQVNLCEYNYDFDNNGNENVTSATPLAARDEIVFLARDSGPRAPNSTVWLPGNVSTTRYEIELRDVRSAPAKKGWVYAFLWLEEHAPETAFPYYVNWMPGTGNATPSRDEDGTCDFNPLDLPSRRTKACGLFKGLNTNLPGFETYNLNFKGNWITNRLQLRPSTGGTETDVWDRRKHRGTGGGNNETEFNWSTVVCGLHQGNKTGLIRTIYVGQGTESGIGSTIVYKLYPTHLREISRVRLHNNVTDVQTFFDYLSGMSPQPQIYVRSKTTAADTIDGAAPGSTFGQPYELWTQVNTPYGRIVEFFRERRPMPIPQSYYYEDDQTKSRLPESPPLGAYGNHGQQWRDATPWMQDLTCNSLNPEDPNLLYAQLERTLFFTDGGVGAPNSDEAEEYLTWMNTPLETVNRAQQYTIPIPPPAGSNVCPPGFDVLYGSNGRYADLTPSVPSGGCVETVPVAKYRLYRALGMGAFRFLANVTPGQAYRDWAVYRGQTYRYFARSMNADGAEGPPSTTYAVLIVDTESPAAPQNVSATSSNQSVSLTWVNPKTWDIRGFNVYAATSPGGPYVRANQVLITGTDAYSVQGLQNDIQYYFVVRSKDWGDNESVNSAEVSATPHP
jgi:hypothetical protein